ncbi:MAG: uroporphyrinogen-III synthase [Salinisphaera sp.]|nr:uroporphyrinogen-III synthase [Salinisphaera sp.]
MIEQAGYTAQAVPTLEIVAAADPDTLALQAKRQLTAATMAVFISRNAVDWLWRLPVDSMRLLNDCRLFAVGPATAARLHEYGLTQVATPEVGADSESLLALRLLAAPHNEQILIVRGCGGRELIATTLRERGAVVEYLEVYERRAHAGTAARLPQLWRQHPRR